MLLINTGVTTDYVVEENTVSYFGIGLESSRHDSTMVFLWETKGK